MGSAVASEPVLVPSALDFDLKEHYEIIDGKRVELPPMSAYASVLASRLLGFLSEFARTRGLGQAVMETLFRLPLPMDRNRRLDVAFVSYERWPKGRRQPVKDNAWDVAPDLAAEVVSPNDVFEDLLDRVDEYFRAGVRMIWVVSPQHQLVYVYETDRKIRVLGRSDELDGGSVLPGFRIALTAIFEEEPSTT
jgi:Uma2 family endonuclease